MDCGFLSSIVADDLAFYPLLDDPLCAVLPSGHPLAEHKRITLPQLFQYPLIIETFGPESGVVARPLSPACHRTLGLAFSKTSNSVVSRTMLAYLQKKYTMQNEVF